MGTVPNDYQLEGDQRENPVVWTAHAPQDALGLIRLLDLTDDAMQRYLGRGKSMKLKSFGHDAHGVHFLLTRAGTTVHRDQAFTRYSHQLILRNDGNRLRGLPRYDPDDPADWHEPLRPGVMYALDTHSPHQGLADPRFANRGAGMKAVLAVDRDTVLEPDEAYALFEPWLKRGVQFVQAEDPAVVAARPSSPRTVDGRRK